MLALFYVLGFIIPNERHVGGELVPVARTCLVIFAKSEEKWMMRAGLASLLNLKSRHGAKLALSLFSGGAITLFFLIHHLPVPRF